jgi:hypothetical protein
MMQHMMDGGMMWGIGALRRVPRRRRGGLDYRLDAHHQRRAVHVLSIVAAWNACGREAGLIASMPSLHPEMT